MKSDVLFAAPSQFAGDDAFYVKRDAFRFVQYLESIVVSAKMVLLPSATGKGVPADKRLLVAPYAQWTSPEFLNGFGVRTVVVYGFGVICPRKMLPVFRAVREAGCRLVFQMDSGVGLSTFLFRPWTSFKRRYWQSRGVGRSVLRSALRAAAKIAHAAWGGPARFLCKTLLPLCNSIRVESEMALENTRKRIRSLHQAETAERVVLATHPVPDAYAWNRSRVEIEKRKRIVCVALDWRNPRKGGRVLAKALARVLPGSGWEAVLVGNHADEVANGTAAAKRLVRPVLEADSSVLEPIYKESRIFVTASGAEEAPNVVYESLASGCSVVFPPELVHLDSIVRAGAGTMSRHRTVRLLAEAIHREMDAWGGGLRDADEIFRRVGRASLASVLYDGLARSPKRSNPRA